MKKIILIALTTLAMVGCTNNSSEQKSAAPTGGNNPSDQFIVQFGLKVAFPDGADFGVITDANIKSKVYYVSNTGDEDSAVGSVSIIGDDASSFQLLNSSCPTLVKNEGNYCSIRVRFTPQGKANRIYSAKLKVDQLELPFTADLQVSPATEVPGGTLKVYESAAEVTSLDFGQTLHGSLAKYIQIRHSSNGAIAPLSIVPPMGWTSTKASCTPSEINSGACSTAIVFKGPGTALGVYNANLVLGALSIPMTAEVVTLAGKNYGPGAAPALEYSIDDQVVSSTDLGTLLVPNRVKLSVKVKNVGNAPASGLSLYLDPANSYFITGSNCQKVIMPGADCLFVVNLSTVGKVSGNYSTVVKITDRPETLTINASILGISCAIDEHVNPQTFVCEPNVYVLSLASGHGQKVFTWNPASLQYVASISCDANFVPKPGDLCVYSGQSTATFISMGYKRSTSPGFKVVSEIGGSPMKETITNGYKIDRGDKE